MFSADDKTLLVGHSPAYSLVSQWADTTVTALNSDSGFKFLWQQSNLHFAERPQFFANDSKILVDGGSVKVLNSDSGRIHLDYEHPGRLVASPNGKWVAYDGLAYNYSIKELLLEFFIIF
ncbi:MAG: hypothetical protein EOO20_27595 [Chryseobacterium sp.]|nr:MAG: hypothetical protein EOO20_27595 [Chryseobacterium sp.]